MVYGRVKVVESVGGEYLGSLVLRSAQEAIHDDEVQLAFIDLHWHSLAFIGRQRLRITNLTWGNHQLKSTCTVGNTICGFSNQVFDTEGYCFYPLF